MPRKPTQSDWNRFARGAGRRTKRLVQKYADEKLTAQEFREQFRDLLADRHGRAGYLGRLRGGADWEFDDDDREFGQVIADAEDEFLEAFAMDLDLGRYRTPKGDPDVAAINRRAQMYVKKLRATSNEAFTGTAATDDHIHWIMAAAEHCEDCKRMARNSPYAPEDLHIYPGSGETACLTNCKCRLKRDSDHVEGFRAE